jgi:hypothetical protein
MLFGLFMVTGAGAGATPLVTPTSRDGHADFDFLIGRWHTHYRFLRERLAHDSFWDECDGDATVTGAWGVANMEVSVARCRPPRGNIDSMTLCIYSPGKHQWSLYWGTRKIGLELSPQVGHFNEDGVGDFFADSTFRGKPVTIRYRWSTKNRLPHLAHACSADGGVTWETNWICDYTRV